MSEVCKTARPDTPVPNSKLPSPLRVSPWDYQPAPGNMLLIPLWVSWSQSGQMTSLILIGQGKKNYNYLVIQGKILEIFYEVIKELGGHKKPKYSPASSVRPAIVSCSTQGRCLSLLPSLHLSTVAKNIPVIFIMLCRLPLPFLTHTVPLTS